MCTVQKRILMHTLVETSASPVVSVIHVAGHTEAGPGAGLNDNQNWTDLLILLSHTRHVQKVNKSNKGKNIQEVSIAQGRPQDFSQKWTQEKRS